MRNCSFTSSIAHQKENSVDNLPDLSGDFAQTSCDKPVEGTSKFLTFGGAENFFESHV